MKNFPLTDEQVLDFADGNEAVLADHFDDLYEYYLSNGEMPYGVAKARDGDPDQWIADQLENLARTIRIKRDSDGYKGGLWSPPGDGDRVYQPRFVAALHEFRERQEEQSLKELVEEHNTPLGPYRLGEKFEISKGGITIRGHGNAAEAEKALDHALDQFVWGPPGVGRAERVSLPQDTITIEKLSGYDPVRIITESDLDDGTGVGLLPSIDYLNTPFSDKEYSEEVALRSSWSNPIWYRGYRIYVPDYVPGKFAQFAYEHEGYDGPEDTRCGHTATVAEAKAEIDEREDDQ